MTIQLAQHVYSKIKYACKCTYFHLVTIGLQPCVFEEFIT